MKDMLNLIHLVPAIQPAVNTNLGTTALTGASIDRRGYEALTFAIITGALTDADAVYAVTMEEADDNGSGSPGAWTAVAAADIIGTLALAGFNFANDGVCRKVGYIGNKQWVRIIITPTTTADSGNSPIAVIAILGKPTQVPTANPPA